MSNSRTACSAAASSRVSLRSGMPLQSCRPGLNTVTGAVIDSGNASPLALLALVERLGREVAGPAADDVDRSARLPHEAIDALRRERLLSASVPAELGGFGCAVSELAGMCEALGQ